MWKKIVLNTTPQLFRAFVAKISILTLAEKTIKDPTVIPKMRNKKQSSYAYGDDEN